MAEPQRTTSLPLEKNDPAVAPPPFATNGYEHLLACPSCAGRLDIVRGLQHGAACTACNIQYPYGDAAEQIDLRLQKSKTYVSSVELGEAPESAGSYLTDALAPNSTSKIADWRGLSMDAEITYGNRLTAELVSYFPIAENADEWMLDLGCGPRTFETFCKNATGFNYVGIDYGGAESNLLADAHALPFKDQSFFFILSIAVLEHLAYPDIAMEEAFRVLKPGGIFIGTVAFLESFHMDSHFHMTHLGTSRVLHHAGFEILAMAPNKEWSALRAQAEMSLYPILPRPLKHAASAPAEMFSKALWAAKRLAKGADSAPNEHRLLENTGGFRFVAQRLPDV